MPVRAKEAFIVALKGERERVVQAGDVFSDKDPVVKGRESLFEDVDEVIERASAAPGERRVTPKKKDS